MRAKTIHNNWGGHKLSSIFFQKSKGPSGGKAKYKPIKKQDDETTKNVKDAFGKLAGKFAAAAPEDGKGEDDSSNEGKDEKDDVAKTTKPSSDTDTKSQKPEDQSEEGNTKRIWIGSMICAEILMRDYKMKVNQTVILQAKHSQR